VLGEPARLTTAGCHLPAENAILLSHSLSVGLNKHRLRTPYPYDAYPGDLADRPHDGPVGSEVRIAAGLQHQNVLALYDSGEADGFLYYVMPFVEGESLRERLKREKQLPLEDALQIAREVADALSSAHSQHPGQ